MDIATVAGLLTVFAMMGGSLLVMGIAGNGAVNYAAFIDPAAIMMVIGGSLGVCLGRLPASQRARASRNHQEGLRP